MNFYEILKTKKLGRGSPDYWTQLFAEHVGGKGEWKIAELTGTLPITFRSNGTALIDYRIYGTADGAGVQTENLWDESWVNGRYSSVGAYDSNPNVIASDPDKPIPVQSGTTYYIKQFKNVSKIEVFFYSGATEGFISYDTIDPDVSNSFVVPQYANYMRFDCYRPYGSVYANDIVISTAFPTAYAPYGYKLPLTVTSGEGSKTADVYIGDSKLGAEEYVDYQKQKVYKRTEQLFDENTAILGKEIRENGIFDNANWAITPLIPVEPQSYYSTLSFGVARLEYMSENDNNPTRTVASSKNPTLSTTHFIRLNLAISNLTTATLIGGSTPPKTYIPYLQPKDPPIPFPEFKTFKGTNTLDSTETLGEVTIKGQIKPQS